MIKLKLIDENTAKAKLETYIARTEKQLSVVKMVIDSLTAMEGKSISARIATALTKQFPSLKFSVVSPYSWYSLVIRGDGFDEIDMQLAYTSEPKVITIKRIIQLNQRYLLDEQRLVVYRDRLSSIVDEVAVYNDAIVSLMNAQKLIDPIKFVVTDNDLVYAEDIDGNSLNY